MKILVTGGRGMLARELRRRLPGALYLDESELDITDEASVRAVFMKHQPRLVLNLAACTKVDLAESDEAAALAVNGAGPGHLARACHASGAHLIHVSTDYVFNGQSDRPWREEDPVADLGLRPHQAAGELEVAGECPASLVSADGLAVWRGRPRLRGHDAAPGRGARGDPRRRRSMGCPAWTGDLADALIKLGEGRVRGLCHWSNSGPVPGRLARRILGRAGYRGRLIPISSGELLRPAPRPAYSVLSTKPRQPLARLIPKAVDGRGQSVPRTRRRPRRLDTMMPVLAVLRSTSS